MSILAKSNADHPVTLDEHNQHLQEQWDREISPHRAFVCRKYRILTGQDLSELLTTAIHWHDEGKKHPTWQNACQKDFEESRRTGKPCGKHLKQAHIRHELSSLEYISRAKSRLPLSVRVAIAAHHGKLSRKHKKRWGEEHQEFEKFWLEFARLGNSFRLADIDQIILNRYEFTGPRALLQLADHRASARESGEKLPKLIPFRYTFPYKNEQGGPALRGVQRLIEQLWDDPFAILRAPTGSGKTDAALLWAQYQIAHDRADRLVIAMPTRFTANALAVSTAENLSKNGLYHSSAWFKEDDRKNLEIARLLETPVTVTTIDHLCLSLTGTREDHHGIFFNLAHSCVVIDEADFYDAFTQQNIVMLLRALRLLKVPVLLMSATIPKSATELYAQSGFVVANIYEDTTDYEMPRCTIKRYGRVEKPGDIEHLLERALKGEQTIIYANTVKRAQAYYRWFCKRGCKHVVLYHSRFTEPDKAKKETKIRRMLGEKAWKKGKAHGVAILTQIGELSVNISADLMISDLCPIDRLAQRVGRLSRFDKDKMGALYVVDPYKIGDENLYPAPYGRWVSNKGWELSEALKKSDELLKEGEYSAKRFVDMVNEVYPVVPPVQPHVRINNEKLENCMVGNWLVGPVEHVEEDDEDTKDWKSRDIPLQKMVYANFTTSGIDINQDFPSWRAFREFQLKHGIQCHSYEHDKALDNGRLEETTFLISSNSRDEYKEEKARIVRSGYYDFKMGLHFDLDDED